MFHQEVVILFLFYISYTSSNTTEILIDDFYFNQARLYTHLFRKYNSKIAAAYPVGYTGRKYVVDVRLRWCKLIEVVEPQESLATTLEYDKMWNDTRLKWNPEDYGGIEEIFVNREDIWVPETGILDLLSLTIMRATSETGCLLEHTGRITMFVSNVLSVICNLDVSLFPFDKQTCKIAFFPLTYKSEDYGFNITKKENLDLSSLGNGEWKVVNITADYITYSSGVTQAFYNISIARYSTYYVAMIVLPSFILNTISVIGIFLKSSGSAEKLMIGLTNMLSLIFIFGMISDNLPSTKYLPLLGYYILVNLFIMVIAVLVSLWIPFLHKLCDKYTKPKGKSRLTCLAKHPQCFSVATFLHLVVQLANLTNFVYFISHNP